MNIKKIQHFERFTDIPEIEKFSNVVPVFASQEYANYLKEIKSYSTIWFYGEGNPDSKFLIPFAVRNRFIFKIGTFLTATICTDDYIDNENEREFLNSVVAFIKQKKLCDWIQQTPNWALFNSIPSNSISCEFGTYRIDIQNNDPNEIMHKMKRSHRQQIKHALSNPTLTLRKGPEFLEDCIKVFYSSNSGKNNKLPPKSELIKLLDYLSDKIHIYVSYQNDIPQSSVIYFIDKNNFYAIYAARVDSSVPGLNHLLHWQAMLDARLIGVNYFDFVGGRADPLSGSKQEGIKCFKSRFGGEFVKGFLWKMPISKPKYYFYLVLNRFNSSIRLKNFKGDTIDQELRNIKSERIYVKLSKKNDERSKAFSINLNEYIYHFSTLFLK